MMPAPRTVILHADDLGLSAGVNSAILAAHQANLVLSASIMAGMPAFAAAAALARATPTLDIGLHLNLTTGRPCLPAARLPSLTGHDGCFHRLGRFLALAALGRIAVDELTAELEAQAKHAQAAGLTLTHLDGHHHVHLVQPVTTVVAALGTRLGIRVIRRAAEGPLLRASVTARQLLGGAPLGANWRRRQVRGWFARGAARQLAGFAAADYFGGLPLSGPPLSRAQFSHLLCSLPPGVTELMCHPAQPDAALLALDPTGALAKQGEAALLVDASLAAEVESNGVRFGRAGDLAQRRYG